MHCTNEPNVSIPHLANLLIERSQNTNWVVVYKALITTHHLMAYGNEVGNQCFLHLNILVLCVDKICPSFLSWQRFMQYLASSNSTFNLSNFLDKGGVQGKQNSEIHVAFTDFATVATTILLCKYVFFKFSVFCFLIFFLVFFSVHRVFFTSPFFYYFFS